jgi:hypothetical protein
VLEWWVPESESVLESHSDVHSVVVAVRPYASALARVLASRRLVSPPSRAHSTRTKRKQRGYGGPSMDRIGEGKLGQKLYFSQS